MTIYLIGTDHLDVLGPKRLEKILNYIRPGVIALEATEEFSKKRTKEHNTTVLCANLIKAVLEIQYGEKADNFMQRIWLLWGYEDWVTETYKKDHQGTKLLYLDNLTESEANAFDYDGWGVELNDVLNKSPEEYQKETDISYDDNSVDDFTAQELQKLLIERDEFTETRIREVFRFTVEDMVYVGGADHIFGNYHNLYERLKDLNPVRKKLRDAEEFVLAD